MKMHKIWNSFTLFTSQTTSTLYLQFKCLIDISLKLNVLSIFVNNILNLTVIVDNPLYFMFQFLPSFEIYGTRSSILVYKSSISYVIGKNSLISSNKI